MPPVQCPVCAWPPFLLLNPHQAMCGTEGCPVFLWDPSAADPLANVQVLELPPELCEPEPELGRDPPH